MNERTVRLVNKSLELHRWIYERSDGRIGASLGGRPMLLLHSVGRRTGQPRTSALAYARLGDAYVIVASNNGGPKHPAWLHNLRAQPDVDIRVGRETIPVRAHVAEGDERTAAWAAADAMNKGQYTTYQARTERPIEVVVLEPR